MRITINIEDDVLQAVKHISHEWSEPLGMVVSAILRKYLSGAREAVYENDLPVVQIKENARPITLEDVKRDEDE